MTDNLNLFATVLTYPAPSSNYHGEGEDTRKVLQKIKKNNHDYTIISPESMRNALREMLAKVDPNLCNRERLHDKNQPAVKFKGFPNPAVYADDFLFGYLVTNKKQKAENTGEKMKRDSVFRMNMAVALTPYHPNNTVFFQSPQSWIGDKKNPARRDREVPLNSLSESEDSALLHREVAHTAYQYPFALAGSDCRKGKGAEWTRILLKAIGELSDVAGGHARSFSEMSPKSIVARLTPQLVAGFNTYGFDEHGAFQELKRIKAKDLPNEEQDLPGTDFWIGGEIVRSMDAKQKKDLQEAGAHLYENPQILIADLTKAFLPQEKK